MGDWSLVSSKPRAELFAGTVVVYAPFLRTLALFLPIVHSQADVL